MQAVRLARIDRNLISLAALGGLLGGAVLLLVMGGYYSANNLGFSSMLSFCIAGFVYDLSSGSAAGGMGMESSHGSAGGKMPMGSETTMAGSHSMSASSMPMGSETTMAGSHSMGAAAATGSTHSGGMMMMSGSQPASHLAVGSILHTAMSVTAGIAFALVLAFLIRAGLRSLSNPVGYVLGGATGGAILYLIMMYAVSPALNTNIKDFTPRAPFFFAHLLYGATVAGFVYWRRHSELTASTRMAPAGA